MARELQRLDEEKKVMEELSRERIERERALNERELQERMEREKQFIARKHELLNRQDEEEGRSVRSMRSSQRSAQRTEDWVKQTASEVVGPSSTPVDAEDTSLGHPQGVHPSSTPVKIVDAVFPTAVDNGLKDTGSEVKPISEALGSLADTSEEPIEDVDKMDDAGVQYQPGLPTVDVKPYSDLLKPDEVVPAGAFPKVKRVNPSKYQRWSVETGELRQQNAKAIQQQEQMEVKHWSMQEMVRKLQFDIDTTRKRELGLEGQLKSLQIQHAEELRLIHNSETGLQDQLKQQQRENACLRSQIASLNEELQKISTSRGDLLDLLQKREDGITSKELQIQMLQKKLVETTNQMRVLEADLREQLSRRNRECEILELQRAELENEIQGLRTTEQRLQKEMEASLQREREAIRERNTAEQEYWKLHDVAQQFVNRNEHWASEGGCSPPLPPPPAAWLDQAASDDCSNALPPPPPPLSDSAYDCLPGMSGYYYN
nr:intracellular protein transport protein USO1-like [Aedes albopictus]